MSPDRDVLRAVNARAGVLGRPAGEIVEDAVRRRLGLGALERPRACREMDPDEADALALEAQAANRRAPS